MINMKRRLEFTTAQIEKIRSFILSSHDFFFSDSNRAKSWADFDFFKDFENPVTRRQLCMPEEPFITDRDFNGEHTLCIVTISAKNRLTAEIPVIRLSELGHRGWKNGYWLIPKLK